MIISIDKVALFDIIVSDSRYIGFDIAGDQEALIEMKMEEGAMKAKRVWTVCLAVLTLLALLAGCGKQESPSFDGSFNLVLKSEYQGDLTKVDFRLTTDSKGKRCFISGSFTEPYRTPDDMEFLVYGKQYSMPITNLEYLTGRNIKGIWVHFEIDRQECGRVFIPEDQLHGGTVRVVLDSSGSVVSEAAAS